MHLLATTDLSPVVTLWIYFAGGLIILFGTIAMCCFIVNARHDAHLEDMHEKANDK